jgi:peroxiredoxin
VQRYIVWLVAAAALGVAVVVFEPFFVASPSRSEGPAASKGQPAPVFPLRDDRGASVSLADYRGKIVVMNLWASWCPPCRAEMPDLQRLADYGASRGIAVVGVNEGESEDRARVFAASLRIHYPIWIDASQRYGRMYNALGLPTTVIVDRKGVVARAYDGALTFDQMRKSAIAAATGP